MRLNTSTETPAYQDRGSPVKHENRLSMKHLPYFLLGLLFLAECRADDLGGGAEITPASGWVRVDPRDAGNPSPLLPTLAYVPKDGRNAAVLLTLFPAALSKVSDLASLKAFLLRDATPMLPSPDFVPVIRDLALSDGFGVYASFEDPSLLGKPPEKGNYKLATPVDVLLKNGFTVQATVFTDDTGGKDFREALGIVQSAAMPRTEPGIAANTVSVAGLDAGLQLPAGRFKPMPNGLNSNPGYFSFEDSRGVILSGWLDHSSRFEGMKAFWAKEKVSIETKAGIQLQSVTSERIGEWDAILYLVPMGKDIAQKNVRACRVVGDTWADIHLSITSPGSTWKDLEDVVRSISLSSTRPSQPVL